MIRSARQRVIALLATRWPGRLYAAIGLFALATAPVVRRAMTVRQLCAVFPHLRQADAVRVARELRCCTLKSRALGAGLARARGEPVYPPVTVDAGFADVCGPAILISFHVGPVGALGEVIGRLPGEVLAMHRMEWAFPSNVTELYVEQSAAAAAAAFHRAVITLRRGGCVAMLTDGPGPEVCLLGRRTPFERGPYALARLTGAPIVPLLAHWDGASVDVVCGETIPALQDEAAMAAAAAAALERHLHAHPAEIDEHLLATLSRAPAADQRSAR